MARTDLEPSLHQPNPTLMLEFVAAMAETTQDAGSIVLIRTRQLKLSPEQAKALFRDSDNLVAVRLPRWFKPHDSQLSHSFTVTRLTPCRKQRKQARRLQDQSSWSFRAQGAPAEPPRSSRAAALPAKSSPSSPRTRQPRGTYAALAGCCHLRCLVRLSPQSFVVFPRADAWRSSSSSSGDPQSRDRPRKRTHSS